MLQIIYVLTKQGNSSIFVSKIRSLYSRASYNGTRSVNKVVAGVSSYQIEGVIIYARLTVRKIVLKL